MAYCPLAQATKLHNRTLKAVAKAHPGKSTAQIMLRWGIQRRFIVIPRSKARTRIRENAGIWDFKLGRDEMRLLDSLEADYHADWNPLDEEFVD